LVLPKTVPQPFSDELADYTIRMRSELGYSETTIYERRQRAINFLKWYGKKRRELSRISVRDVDNYLAESARRWKLITLAGECTFLRSFFYHAGFRGWCSRSIAPAIKPPVVRRDIFEPQGPKWKDVLRLLRSMRGSDSVTIRAKAVISLYAIYGLRSSEAIRIRLRDIDWTRNSFTVRRAKRGGIQEFPMQAEVREAIRRYIEKVRPDCDCPEVFVSLHKPYRAMRSHSMGRVVSRRMKALGIESKHHGPQSLRHACATHLLDCGAHLEDIADFLGHRSCEAVRVYAKFSKRSLREVVRVDLTKSL
jgi:site-specific recombinase XerD